MWWAKEGIMERNPDQALEGWERAEERRRKRAIRNLAVTLLLAGVFVLLIVIGVIYG